MVMNPTKALQVRKKWKSLPDDIDSPQEAHPKTNLSPSTIHSTQKDPHAISMHNPWKLRGLHSLEHFMPRMRWLDTPKAIQKYSTPTSGLPTQPRVDMPISSNRFPSLTHNNSLPSLKGIEECVLERTGGLRLLFESIILCGAADVTSRRGRGAVVH